MDRKRGTWRRAVAVMSCVVVGAACTASSADPLPAEAARTTTSASPADSSWPGSYSEGEEGAWTSTSTRAQIISRAREQAVRIPCVRSFLESLGFEDTITWDLYLRDGQWILYGSIDGGASEAYDGGTYTMPHIENELAMFTANAPDVRDDYWLYPDIDEDSLLLGFVHLTQWGLGKPQPCFGQGAVMVEMTNPFERVA